MTYVVVSSGSLAGVHSDKPGIPASTRRALLLRKEVVRRVQTRSLGGAQGSYELGSVTNALGQVGGERLADGTTPGQRELIIAQLSQVIHDWTKKLDDILGGTLSLSSVFTSAGPIFSMQAAQARMMVQRARDSLTGTAHLDGLLPAASRALRDYSRDVSEIQSTVQSALANMEASVQGSIQVAEKARIGSIFQKAKDDAKKVLKSGLEEVPDALPPYVLIGGGLVALAYLYNTLRGR